MTDHALTKWNRGPTPAAGLAAGLRVAGLAFPTAFLSPGPEPQGVTWIDAAPADRATVVDLFFTHESESTVRTALIDSNIYHVIKYTTLPNGESFFVAYSYIDWDNKDQTLANGGGDILFSANQAPAGRQAIRMVIERPPGDGETVFLTELCGYVVPKIVMCAPSISAGN